MTELCKSKIRTGNTTSDQMVGNDFGKNFDSIFGSRCIKHPSQKLPCRYCGAKKTPDLPGLK